MELTLNGKRIETDAPTLEALLISLGYTGNHFAVAVNQNCVPRSRFSEVRVQPKDEIEILGPQQGG